jgi:hypothetical protein
MSPVKYQICFSKRYKKLDPLRLNFTTVRWLDSFYRLGKNYEIFYVVPNLYHRKIHLGTARLIKMEIKRIEQLDNVFTQLDADCGINEFYQMLKHWYEKKQNPPWKGANSEIQILYLERRFSTNEKHIQHQLKKALFKQERLEVSQI